jgi:protein-disulfide isomerase
LCANDQGQFWPYHDWLFTNQSPREAAGAFTLNRLVSLGKSAGLNMTTFEPCVRNGTHLAEVAAEQTAAPADASSTPTIYVNNNIVVAAAGATAVPTYDDIVAAINAALNPASPSPSTSAPSPSVAPTASPS